MATLGELQQEAMDLLLEALGDEAGAAGNPFGWETHAVNAVDKLCKATDCFYAKRDSDLSGGEAEYCPPKDLYKLKAILVKEAVSGKWRPLRPSTTQRADDMLLDWRDPAATSGDPASVFIPAPSGPVTLYPTPGADVTGGLRFEGFCAPKKVWEYDPDTGAALDLTDDSVCPIPEWAQGPIPYQMAITRIIQYPTPTNMLRLPMLQAQYSHLAGQVETHAAKWFRQMRIARGPGFPWVKW